MKAEGFEMVCVAERVEGVHSLHDLAHIPPCTSATHADAANHCSSVGHRCTAHAESLRHNCWLWLLLRGKQIALTCSFGVAQYQPDEPTAAWLERVDHCLYRAKQSGRNRVCAWENLDVQI